MHLTPIDRIAGITPAEFRNEYFLPQKPVIITDLSHQWQAYTRWTFEYLKTIVGKEKVGIYNNTRAGAKVPVNGADDYMFFGDYLDLIQQGPVQLRIFLFNIFKAAPFVTADYVAPTQYMSNVLQKFPMIFVGGAGSIAHMHYDIDLSHIFHTQFIGRKLVLLFKNDQSPLIYRMPGTVESAASFVNWQSELDETQFPALKYAHAYHTVLEHGDTLFMPSGYWHHMQYLENGLALSQRAIPEGLLAKLNGLYHLLLLRGYNNTLIKLAPEWWYHYKRKIAHCRAGAAMRTASLA